MHMILAIGLLLFFFALMALGLLVAKRVLRRGCSLGDECTCRKDPVKAAADCDHSS